MRRAEGLMRVRPRGRAGSDRADGTRGAVRDEAGFSMVESIVALTIAAMVLTSSALLLGQALKSTLFARQNQQAAEVLTAELETMRGMDYGALSMVATDLAGDAAISGSPPAVDHDGPGTLAAEALTLSTTGAVNPHVRTVTVNATDYTVARYVSEVDVRATPASPQSLVKRVTVRVSWTGGGNERERVSSTLIAKTRRGLPLPEFTFVDEIVKVVPPGETAVLPKSLTNRGARDRWNLTATSAPALAGFTWYEDRGEIGVYATGVDTALVDTDADLVVDTGLLEVDETIDLLLVQTIPSPAAASYVVEVRATSSAQPTATGGTASLTDTINTTTPLPCAGGCVYRPLLLRNVLPACATACATAALDPMPLDLSSPVATSLDDFDTDLDPTPVTSAELRAGRRIVEGATSSGEVDRSRMARWRYQVPSSTVLSGTASLRFYVAPLDSGLDGAVTYTVFLRRMRSNGNLAAELGQVTGTIVGSSAPFALAQVDVPLSNVAMANNTYLEVKVVVNDDVMPLSTDSMRVAYDTTAYPSTLFVPVVP